MTNYPDADRDGLAYPTGTPTGAVPDPTGPGPTGQVDRPLPPPRGDGTVYESDQARDTAERAKDTVGSATTEVAQTARREARAVGSEIADQARRVLNDAKYKTAYRLDTQQKQWSDQLGEVSRELREMAAARPDSTAGQLVDQLADRSSMLADYLASRRAQDVLAEVQDFARRRPGTYLAALAAAGFVVGRLGRGMVANGGKDDDG
jgi:hypothetical protein